MIFEYDLHRLYHMYYMYLQKCKMYVRVINYISNSEYDIRLQEIEIEMDGATRQFQFKKILFIQRALRWIDITNTHLTVVIHTQIMPRIIF